jgi:dipeptidyl aminopeptidase/acylaminoacyl peptidase
MPTADRGRPSFASAFVFLALILGALGGVGCVSAAPKPAAPGFTVLSTTKEKGITQMEVTYPSDSLVVRGFLFLPKKSGRRPCVIFNHGGVSGVSADMKRRSRDLADEGYVVFAPAYRGEGESQGRIEVAGGEVNDVLAAADLLSRHPRVAADRMAVTGSSHGALISVLAAARAPDRFRCVVAACGVMDVVTWYQFLVESKGVQAVSDSLSLAIYGNGPADRPEAFRARQAVGVAGDIRIPMLMQYAKQDTIVPIGQAYLFTSAMTKAGRPAPELKTYEHLGHAFWFWNDPKAHTKEQLEEAEDSWEDFTEFLEHHLKKS